MQRGLGNFVGLSAAMGRRTVAPPAIVHLDGERGRARCIVDEAKSVRLFPGWRAATATALDLAAATAFAKFANAKVSLSTVTPCFNHSTAYITHPQAGDAALGCTFKPSASPFGSALHKLSDVDARFERHGRNRVSDDAHKPKI